MRSVTSCFNSALYRKNMARFWPLWTLYTIIWLFALPLQLLTILQQGRIWDGDALQRELTYFSETTLCRSLEFGLFLSVVFGLAAAMAVFSYLYNSRSACMIHALPLRREALFFTNYLSGLSFLLLPNLGVFVLTLAAEAAGGCLALGPLAVWLLVQSATCLFFYSFAVFCAMFTGHLLALPVFYGVLNFLVMAVSTLMDGILRIFLYGYNGPGSAAAAAVTWLTPVMQQSEAIAWIKYGDLDGYLSQPLAVAVYAAVGLFLSAAALLVYRCRQMETAGDVVSVSLVRPVFKYGVAACTGLAMGCFTYLVLSGSSPLFLVLAILIWAAVGYFVAEMLLRKSFRVLPAWPGCVVMTAVLAVIFLSIQLDVMGYQNHVPQAAQVSRVQVSVRGSYPSDSGSRGAVELTDPEQIAGVLALHQAVVDARARSEEAGDDYFSFRVVYTLTSGETLQRSYYTVPLRQSERETEGSVTHAVDALLSDRDYLRQAYGLEGVKEKQMVGVYVSRLWNQERGEYVGMDLLPAQASQLWQAVLADFQAGTIGTRYLFQDQTRQENTCPTDLDFEFYVPTQEYEMSSITWAVSITMTPHASNTIRVMEELGVLNESRTLRTNAQAEEEEAQTAEVWDWE